MTDAKLELTAGNTPRRRDEWNEEQGPVLWFRLPIEEPPHCGSPIDDDWPDDGYYTHWVPLPAIFTDRKTYQLAEQAVIAESRRRGIDNDAQVEDDDHPVVQRINEMLAEPIIPIGDSRLPEGGQP